MNSNDVSTSYHPLDNHTTSTTTIAAATETKNTRNTAVANQLENFHQHHHTFYTKESPEIIVSSSSNNNSPLIMPKHAKSMKEKEPGTASSMSCSDINENTVEHPYLSEDSANSKHQCVDNNSNNVQPPPMKYESMLLTSGSMRQYKRYSSLNSLSSGCSLDLASDYSDDADDSVNSPTDEFPLKVSRIHIDVFVCFHSVGFWIH